MAQCCTSRSWVSGFPHCCRLEELCFEVTPLCSVGLRSSSILTSCRSLDLFNMVWFKVSRFRTFGMWYTCRIHLQSETSAWNICILTDIHLQYISAVTNMHERLLAILLHGLTARFCIALTNHAPVSAYVHIVDKCLSINLMTRHLVALTHHAHEHKVINSLSDYLMAHHRRRSTVQFLSPMPFAWHMSWS